MSNCETCRVCNKKIPEMANHHLASECYDCHVKKFDYTKCDVCEKELPQSYHNYSDYYKNVLFDAGIYTSHQLVTYHSIMKTHYYCHDCSMDIVDSIKCIKQINLI
jgi:hypothetical protein